MAFPTSLGEAVPMVVAVEVYVENEFWQQQSADIGRCDSQDLIPSVLWEQWFSQWLKLVSTDLPPASGYELSLRLTDDLGIRALNAQYRHQDQPTDVLAFAALETHFPQSSEFLQLQPLYLGDIIISVETANRQAQQQGHGLKTELAWLATHGCLHLLGWNHPDLDSLNRMMNQQVILLQAIDVNINPESIRAILNESEIV